MRVHLVWKSRWFKPSHYGTASRPRIEQIMGGRGGGTRTCPMRADVNASGCSPNPRQAYVVGTRMGTGTGLFVPKRVG